MVDKQASSNQVAPRANQQSINPLDSKLKCSTLLKESTSLSNQLIAINNLACHSSNSMDRPAPTQPMISHLLKQRISSHKLDSLHAMDGLSGAPGAARTVACSVAPAGLIMGLVTDEKDYLAEVKGSGNMGAGSFKDGIKGINNQKYAINCGAAAGGVVLTSGSSAAISRGTIWSRKRNQTGEEHDLSGNFGVDALEGGYGDEEDFLEVYVDLVH